MTDYEFLKVMTNKLDCTDAPKALLKLLGIPENEKLLLEVSIVFDSKILFEFNNEWYKYKTLPMDNKELRDIFTDASAITA